MPIEKSDPLDTVLRRLSDVSVGLEGLEEKGSAEGLLKVLALFRDLRTAMDTFDRSAVAVLRQHDVSWLQIASSLGASRDDVWLRFRLAEGEFSVSEQCLAALLSSVSRDDVVLEEGSIYTRSSLREMFGIRDATFK